MAEITYCLYARKSTENDELKALSIDPKIKEMPDQAKRDDRLTEDLIRYRGFMQSVPKQSDSANEAINVDMRDYAKHILITGKREDKQAILACVTTTLYLKKY